MTYLPDTNAVSAYLRGVDPKFMQKMMDSFGDLRLSSIVLAEREFVVTRGSSTSNRLRLAELAQTLPVEPVTREDSTHYAAIRHDHESRGEGIGPMDTPIAAQALRIGATIVTRNVREFARIRGLSVEN